MRFNRSRFREEVSAQYFARANAQANSLLPGGTAPVLATSIRHGAMKAGMTRTTTRNS